MIVLLTPEEIECYSEVGNQRYNACVKANVKDTIRSGQDPQKIHRLGAVGEYVFCKAFGLKFDLCTKPRSGSEDGILDTYTDANIKRPLRYDVKSTKNKEGHLWATRKINKDVELYVLVHVGGEINEIVGYAFKEDFINKEHEVTTESGLCYQMYRSELTPFIEP